MPSEAETAVRVVDGGGGPLWEIFSDQVQRDEAVGRVLMNVRS